MNFFYSETLFFCHKSERINLVNLLRLQLIVTHNYSITTETLTKHCRYVLVIMFHWLYMKLIKTTNARRPVLVVGFKNSGGKDIINAMQKSMSDCDFRTETLQFNIINNLEYSNHISRSQFVSFQGYCLVIFAIDGTSLADDDTAKSIEAQLGFDLSEKMLAQEGVPCLFLTTKSDVEGFNGSKAQQIANNLAQNCGVEKYCVQEVSTQTGSGIREAIDWAIKNSIEKPIKKY
jgi:hypothetical protein